MSKIVTIEMENFKAIDKQRLDFNGCTAIITAGNNKGKTSVLRGIIDRIRFIRPEKMVKIGAGEGKGELILTTGEKFIWDFNDVGVDKLIHISAEGIKTAVTKEFGKKFFPPAFDIDEFLNSTPKEQVRLLQKQVGIDFTAIDKRYEEAYKERAARNDDSERFHVKLSKMLEVPEVMPVDLTQLQQEKKDEKDRLNNLYLLNKQHNDELRKKWSEQNEINRKEISESNVKRLEAEKKLLDARVAQDILKAIGYEPQSLTDHIRQYEFDLPKIKKESDFNNPEPKYITELPADTELQRIDKKIVDASEINSKAKAYREYKELEREVAAAKEVAKQCDVEVKKIEDERKAMIENANFPKGITVDNGEIRIDGLPLDNNQISSSRKYTAALQIGAIALGEVKSLYFDASYCDRKTLDEIFAWAEERDYQLLIERPDFEGGEIKYEIREHKLN